VPECSRDWNPFTREIRRHWGTIPPGPVVQTIRELEQLYPTYPFKASIQPLVAKLKDESADRVVRLLSALALDELHSDAGDATIREVAASTKDKDLQVLCNALLVRSTYN
jgi:hypothetical protein